MPFFPSLKRLYNPLIERGYPDLSRVCVQYPPYLKTHVPLEFNTILCVCLVYNSDISVLDTVRFS